MNVERAQGAGVQSEDCLTDFAFLQGRPLGSHALLVGAAGAALQGVMSSGKKTVWILENV